MSEDYIIMKTGYDIAIEDAIKKLEDLSDFDVIKSRLLRLKKQYEIGNKQYEGSIYKYYDKVQELGFVILDDIYEIKGACIFVEEGTYKELEEKELLWVKDTYEIKTQENFKNIDLIKLRYNDILNKFKRLD